MYHLSPARWLKKLKIQDEKHVSNDAKFQYVIIDLFLVFSTLYSFARR